MSVWLEPSIAEVVDRNRIWKSGVDIISQLLAAVLPEDELIKTPAREFSQLGVPEWKHWPAINCDFIVSQNTDDHFIMEDNGKSPAVWPIKAGVAFNDDGKLKIRCAETITPKQVRGSELVNLFSKHMVICWSIFVEHGRVVDFGSGYFSRSAGGQWVNANTHVNRTRFAGGPNSGSSKFTLVADKRDPMMPVMIGNLLRLRYEWTVTFRFPLGQKLQFSAAPAGVLALLKDRELGENETRRASLLHWVSQHRRRVSSDTWSDVIRHLRGRENCTWRGIEVEITPAQG